MCKMIRVLLFFLDIAQCFVNSTPPLWSVGERGAICHTRISQDLIKSLWRNVSQTIGTGM